MSIEDLLGPHVWRGKTAAVAPTALPTGFEALDRKLSGGWPWGTVIEIFVERYGIGELSLLMPALASLSADTSLEGSDSDKPDGRRRAGWIVWVAPPMMPYAPALTRCGVELERILLVHPAARARRNEHGAATLWVVEQALRSGASVAVLAWLESATDTQLRRLQLAAQQSRCGLMLFRPATALRQRSPAAVRLKLSSSGHKARIDILKCRGARPARLSLDLLPEAMRGSAPLGAAER